MATEGPNVYYFGGDTCWAREDLVPAATLACLSDDDALRLVDEATGVILRVDVVGEEREVFLARGRLGLSVRPVVSSRTIPVEGGPRLDLVSLADGSSFIVGVGQRSDFVTDGPDEDSDLGPSESIDEEQLEGEWLSFRVTFPTFDLMDGPMRSDHLFVSWIIDPKVRKGHPHQWSADGFPTIHVQSGGTVKAGGRKYPSGSNRVVEATGFDVATTNTVVTYDMTGKNLYLNGVRYP